METWKEWLIHLIHFQCLIFVIVLKDGNILHFVLGRGDGEGKERGKGTERKEMLCRGQESSPRYQTISIFSTKTKDHTKKTWLS
jgi:hypothetical protein